MTQPKVRWKSDDYLKRMIRNDWPSYAACHSCCEAPAFNWPLEELDRRGTIQYVTLCRPCYRRRRDKDHPKGKP